MASAQIRELLSDLPFTTRNAVEGYVDAVDAVVDDIALEANIELTSDIRDDFLFIIAIRKIWTTVNGQYWVLHTSANIAEEIGIDGFQVGRERVGRGMDANTQ